MSPSSGFIRFADQILLPSLPLSSSPSTGNSEHGGDRVVNGHLSETSNPSMVPSVPTVATMKVMPLPTLTMPPGPLNILMLIWIFQLPKLSRQRIQLPRLPCHLLTPLLSRLHPMHHNISCAQDSSIIFSNPRCTLMARSNMLEQPQQSHQITKKHFKMQGGNRQWMKSIMH